MGESPTYQVVSSGEINPSFDSQQVLEACASLFKTTPDKAQSLLGKRRVLKKGLDLETARAYVQKLENIGLMVTVKEHRPEPAKAPLTLALEPTEEERNAQQEAPSPSNETITCPKCQMEQPKTDQCTGCGVYLHKVMARREEPVNQVSSSTNPPGNQSQADQQQGQENEENSDEAVETFNLKALGAAAGAALLGALVWKFIAAAFGYELGLIAWLIGGAVGYASIALGGRGQVSGIACGVLALVAILGGKYMAIQSLQSQWFEILSSSKEFNMEDLRPMFESLQEASLSYQSDVSDEESLKQFMVNYGYSEASEPEDVSSWEVSDFKENYEPELLSMATQHPGFEQWLKASFTEDIEGMSTWELMKEDFGPIDILFLFLGIGTAFRLGSGLQRA